MSPDEVCQAEKDGNPIYRIQSADENGFEADVTNARIVNNGTIFPESMKEKFLWIK